MNDFEEMVYRIALWLILITVFAHWMTGCKTVYVNCEYPEPEIIERIEYERPRARV